MFEFEIACKDSANRAKNQILFEFFRDEAYLRPHFEVKVTKITSLYTFLSHYMPDTVPIRLPSTNLQYLRKSSWHKS